MTAVDFSGNTGALDPFKAVPMNGQMLRDRIASDFERVRAQTEALAAPLSAEDQCAQSMPEASPVKWHRAHTTWFFETFVLGPAGVERLSPEPYAVLFNSYYNAVGEQYDRPSRGLLTRPGHDEVTAIANASTPPSSICLAPASSGDLAERIEVGLHHEQQHQELLVTDIKHLLSRNPLEPAYADPESKPDDAASTPAMRWADHARGIVRIGSEPERIPLRQRGPGPRRAGPPVSDRPTPRHQRGVRSVHRRWGLRPAGAVAQRGLARGADAGLARSAVLARRPGRLEHIHPSWSRARFERLILSCT